MVSSLLYSFILLEVVIKTQYFLRTRRKEETVKMTHSIIPFSCLVFMEDNKNKKITEKRNLEREGVRPNYDRPGISHLLQHNVKGITIKC